MELHVELFELLRELRNAIALREDLIHYQIFTQKSLYAMCETLPTAMDQLQQVHGMGKTRIEKYGTEILGVIRKYCDENDIDTSYKIEISEKPKLKKTVGETKSISLDLFKSGKSIDQIALERELTSNTVFGHLAGFIPSGDVKITDLISEEHFKELKEIIPRHTFESLTDLKHQIDDKYSYGELRLVLEHMKT